VVDNEREHACGHMCACALTRGPVPVHCVLREKEMARSLTAALVSVLALALCVGVRGQQPLPNAVQLEWAQMEIGTAQRAATPPAPFRD
jgi:hypothetical protein